MPRKLSTIGFFMLMVLVWPAAPAGAESGRAAVQQLTTLFSTWKGEPVHGSIAGAAAKHIDYAGMAARALGTDSWGKLTAAQKGEFVTTFRKLVERRYYPRWRKLFQKGSMHYGSETSASGDLLVRTELQIGKKRDALVWRLHPVNGDLMVINLSVGEKDLLTRLTARFQKHLKKGGFTGMMAWLKDKLDEDDEA